MRKISLAVAALAALISVHAARAADVTPMYKAPPAPAAAPWTGCYVGGTAGGVWGRSSINWDPNAPGFSSTTVLTNLGNGAIDTWGFTGGGEVGCNYQFSAIVVGIEGDGEYTGVKGSRGNAFPGCATCGVGGVPVLPEVGIETLESRWLATVRGRVGIGVNDFLFYATGGAAFADVKVSDTILFTGSATTNAAASSSDRIGWVAGVGAEWAFMSHWSVKAEYLFADLGTVSYTSANSNPTAFPVSTILHSHLVTESLGRIGLNWHF